MAQVLEHEWKWINEGQAEEEVDEADEEVEEEDKEED